VPLDAPGDEIELRDDAKLALAIDEQLAFALERRDACIEAMPVLADIDSRSKIAMPVTSLPVPEVVGQAMCGVRGPGTDVPSPTGGLTYDRNSAG
jgi:hypothetical protein